MRRFAAQWTKSMATGSSLLKTLCPMRPRRAGAYMAETAATKPVTSAATVGTRWVSSTVVVAPLAPASLPGAALPLLLCRASSNCRGAGGGRFSDQRSSRAACFLMSASKRCVKIAFPTCSPSTASCDWNCRMSAARSDSRFDSSSGPKQRSNKFFAQTRQCTGFSGVERIVQYGYTFCVGFAWHSKHSVSPFMITVTCPK
mmetsp:Transcript_88845/g.246800  ORF Transcript_88845/g.246800 Transcript_88845/m.246800 type:complete len:201 (+) Transcript_88845:656-1258(+)